MSILTAQCDELREKAKLLRGHADGLEAPYVIPSTKELMALTMLDSAMRMEEAAETIISLRDRLQAAELGSGTCEIVAQTWEDRGGDEEDTYKYELSCGHAVRMLDCEPLHNCPRCGKAVR